MNERFLNYYERLVLRRPLRAVLVVLLIAVLAATGLPRFKLDASTDSLTLEYDESIDFFREINKRYGGGDFLVMTYTPKGMDLFSSESLSTLRDLQEELATVDGVASVTSVLNAPLLYSPKVGISDLNGRLPTLGVDDIDIEAVKREFHESPIYKNLILSPDGQTTALLASFGLDIKYIELARERDNLRRLRDQEELNDVQRARLEQVSREFLEYRTAADERNRERISEIRQLADNYRDRAELVLGGPSMITADMIAFIKSDLKVFGASILLFIVLLLGIIFRQLPWVILPLITCLLSVEIVLGLLSWLDWRLTVISSNFVALLMIITLAITIHLVVRFRELQHDDTIPSDYDKVREMVDFMFRPCLYTVLTTVVAFVSLVISGIRPVIDFGWMMTIGISVAFILSFIIIPCGILLWGNIENNDKGDSAMPFTVKFSLFTERYGTWILTVSWLALIGSAWGISQLQVENRFIDYFRSDTEIYRGLSLIDAKLGGTTPLDIVIDLPRQEIVAETIAEADDPFASEEWSVEDPFAADDEFAAEDPFAEATSATNVSYWFTGAGIRQLNKLHEYLESLPEVGKVNSLATVYQVATDLMEKPLNDLELAFVEKSIGGANKSLLIDPYLDKNLDQTRIVLRAKETEGNLHRQELLRKIAEFTQNELGISADRVHFTGLLVLYSNMLQSLFKSQILTLGAVFVGIMVMFLMLFRSLKIAAIAITPNLLAAALVLGGMGIAGIPLDMMTITIAAITVGIGVDDTIHYVHRFKREFVQDRDYVASMHRAHGSIGRAMYYTSVAVVVGFSILTLSEFIPSVYFGLLTGAAMMAALLSVLLLLPKLLLVFKPLGAGND